MAHRIAVTGGSGFVGREIVRAAKERGVQVTLLSRRAQEATSMVVEGDITTGVGLPAAFRGADTVIHAAGLAHQHRGAPDEAFDAVNREGTRRVILAAAEARVRHVVMLSSVSVYGGSEGAAPLDERAECNPEGPYGVSKLRAEIEAYESARRSSLQLTILRLATVYGAEDPGNLLRLVRAIDTSRFVRIGTRGVRKSLLHRSDAARAVLDAAVARPATGGVFNVVGAVLPLDDIVNCIAITLGSAVPSRGVPRGVALAGTRVLRGVPRLRRSAKSLERWLSDEAFSGITFEDTFGFTPAVSLEEGMRDEVAWYRTQRQQILTA